MGKSRDLFKKSRDTKGTFHAKMGLIKDRNGMDPTEAEDIKKRWQEYTEELYNGSDRQIQGIRFDRVPEELQTEVCDIVQEAMIKTIHKKKKCKKAKWLSEEGLQIAEERRELKAKEKRKDIPI